MDYIINRGEQDTAWLDRGQYDTSITDYISTHCTHFMDVVYYIITSILFAYRVTLLDYKLLRLIHEVVTTVILWQSFIVMRCKKYDASKKNS